MKIIYAESEVVTLVLENGYRAALRLDAMTEGGEYDKVMPDTYQLNLNWKIKKQIQDILGCGVVAVEVKDGKTYKLSDSERPDA